MLWPGGGGWRCGWGSVWLGIGVVVLAAVGGGSAWLLRDEYPFGDARAGDGSDLRLPGVIDVGGAALPADTSDVHYLTRNGGVEVTFLSRSAEVGVRQ